SDFVQVYNADLWAKCKIQRLDTSYTKTYSSDANRGGSYDSPIQDVTDSFSRSYRVEDWSKSYDASGRIDPKNAPIVVTDVSNSLSDGYRWTNSQTNMTYNPD